MGSRENARRPQARKRPDTTTAALALESSLTAAIALAQLTDDRDVCYRLLHIKRDAQARRTLRERGEHAEPPALFTPCLLN